MDKRIVAFLSICIVLFSFLGIRAMVHVFETKPELPAASTATEMKRFVLITQERNTPFWKKVATGAEAEAKKRGIALKVMGSYSTDDTSFLRDMELAIHARVDGILVQGLDNKQFQQLAQVKAAYYGIPVITIGNDVPIDSSLRKTYVGTDQQLAAKRLAESAVSTLKRHEQLVVMTSQSPSYSEKQRLKGVRAAVKGQSIELVVWRTPVEEELVDTTQRLLNEYPQATAFMTLNASDMTTLVQEMAKRMEMLRVKLYTFDDGIDIETLRATGKLNRIVVQQPTEMGKKGVQLLEKWQSGEALNPNGYNTSFTIEEGL